MVRWPGRVSRLRRPGALSLARAAFTPLPVTSRADPGAAARAGAARAGARTSSRTLASCAAASSTRAAQTGSRRTGATGGAAAGTAGWHAAKGSLWPGAKP